MHKAAAGLGILISVAAIGAMPATSIGVLYHQEKATDGFACRYFTGIGHVHDS